MGSAQRDPFEHFQTVRARAAFDAASAVLLDAETRLAEGEGLNNLLVANSLADSEAESHTETLGGAGGQPWSGAGEKRFFEKRKAGRTNSVATG